MTPPTASGPRRQRRRGFTIAEMLLTMTLTIVVFAAALPFFILQLRQITQDLGRTDAQMEARFAQNSIDRELRNIGIGTQPMNPARGIPRNQPKIIQAHAMAVTFNTDLVAVDTGDVEAVYYDPNVPLELTVGMRASNPITLPFAAKTYPDYSYVDEAGALTLSETVSYWASLDSTSSATNEYVLFRRVNNGPVSVVADKVRIPSGGALFQYTRVNANGTLTTVPAGSLPIYWDAANSIADSIRTVTLTVEALAKGFDLNHKAKTWSRTVNSQTALANIGLAQRNSCGDVPLDPRSPTVTLMTDPSGTRFVRVGWTASADETAGEKDVERYAIFRREVGNPFLDPIAMVGKGSSTYTWDDFDLQSGLSFEYGIVAQDCSPANSAMVVTSSILHP